MMRNAGVFAAGVLTGVLVAAALPLAGQERKPLPPETVSALRKITEAWGAIKVNYVATVEDAKLADNCLGGMLRGLDAQSDYLDHAAFEMLRASPPDAAGLGLELRAASGRIMVVSPIEGGPAEKAGIRAGDTLISIDGADLFGMKLNDAVKLMRGPVGSKLELRLLRPGAAAPTDLTLQRQRVDAPSVRGQLAAEGIGYLRVARMPEEAPERLIGTFERLQRENGAPLKGLVLDLRDSPGGLLHASISIASAFVGDDALVAKTDGRASDARKSFTAASHEPGRTARMYPNYPKELRTIPVVVIVNRGTASGSEIVAAALQDHGRATVVGEKTLGLGAIQTIMPFHDNTAIKLTTANWQTPKGRAITNEGIVPDIALPAAAETATAQAFGKPGDGSVSRAVEILATRSPR